MKLMDAIWGHGRARGYAVTGLLAVLTFGGAATAADVVRSASDQQPAGQVFVTPTDTPAATTTDAPPAVAAEAPATSASVAPPAATVDAVTTTAPKAPVIVDPQSVGTTDEHGNYTPAPPIQHPGEPPVGPPTAPPTITPLEGEPGYTGPVMEPQTR